MDISENGLSGCEIVWMPLVFPDGPMYFWNSHIDPIQ